MKTIGKFLVYVSDPDLEKYHPEGTWRVCAAGHNEAAYAAGVSSGIYPPREELSPIGAELFSTADRAMQNLEPVWLEFVSHTGGTGGRLYGCFVAERLFEGEGLVWGAGHTGWQAGSLFAPGTHTAHVWAISPQTYAGSLPGMKGKPIQEAKLAYEKLPQPQPVY